MENEQEVVIAEEDQYRVVQRPNYVHGSNYNVCYTIQAHFRAKDGWQAWRDLYGPYLQKPAALRRFQQTVQWSRERAGEKK